jgi:hypothetical protein
MNICRIYGSNTAGMSKLAVNTAQIRVVCVHWLYIRHTYGMCILAYPVHSPYMRLICLYTRLYIRLVYTALPSFECLALHSRILVTINAWCAHQSRRAATTSATDGGRNVHYALLASQRAATRFHFSAAREAHAVPQGVHGKLHAADVRGKNVRVRVRYMSVSEQGHVKK